MVSNNINNINNEDDIVYNIKQCPKWNLFWYDNEDEYWLKETDHVKDSS